MKFGYIGGFDAGSIISGMIGSGDLAPGSVLSGNIASGQVGWPHLASGAVRSGHIGDTAVVSGGIASGQIGTFHIASGVITSGLLASGFIANLGGNTLVDNTSFISAEIISGVRAVGLNQSGAWCVSMAWVSGRMPALGVAVDNYLSGVAVTVYRNGPTYASGFNFSGYPNRLIWVGESGTLITSGAPVLSGLEQQVLGVVISHSGAYLG